MDLLLLVLEEKHYFILTSRNLKRPGRGSGMRLAKLANSAQGAEVTSGSGKEGSGEGEDVGNELGNLDA